MSARSASRASLFDDETTAGHPLAKQEVEHHVVSRCGSPKNCPETLQSSSKTLQSATFPVWTSAPLSLIFYHGSQACAAGIFIAINNRAYADDQARRRCSVPASDYGSAGETGGAALPLPGSELAPSHWQTSRGSNQSNSQFRRNLDWSVRSAEFMKHCMTILALHADDPATAGDDPGIAADDPSILADDPAAVDDDLSVADDPALELSASCFNSILHFSSAIATRFVKRVSHRRTSLDGGRCRDSDVCYPKTINGGDAGRRTASLVSAADNSSKVAIADSSIIRAASFDCPSHSAGSRPRLVKRHAQRAAAIANQSACAHHLRSTGMLTRRSARRRQRWRPRDALRWWLRATR